MPLDIFYFYHAVQIYFRRHERLPFIFAHASRHQSSFFWKINCDSGLLLSSFALLLLGLVMMTSASIDIAQIQHGEPLYYFWRQFSYILL